jgi:hypothetical protein
MRRGPKSGSETAWKGWPSISLFSTWIYARKGHGRWALMVSMLAAVPLGRLVKLPSHAGGRFVYWQY